MRIPQLLHARRGGNTWSGSWSDGGSRDQVVDELSTIEAELVWWSVPEGAADPEWVWTPIAGLRSAINDETGERERYIRTQYGVLFRDLLVGFYTIQIHVGIMWNGMWLEWDDWSFFRVMPHDVAHDLGPGVTSGSVRCPQETSCADQLDNDSDGVTDCADQNCYRTTWGTYDRAEPPPCFTATFDNLGSEMGFAVASGRTWEAVDDWVFYTETCGWPGTGFGKGDGEYLWTAPATGTYAFWTSGDIWSFIGVSSTTSGDTCNVGWSGLVPLQAGEEVIVVVDGVNHGEWELNIEQIFWRATGGHGLSPLPKPPAR